MWWRRSWFSLKGKAGIPGQTEGCPATSIGPRVLPVGSLQQRAMRNKGSKETNSEGFSAHPEPSRQSATHVRRHPASWGRLCEVLERILAVVHLGFRKAARCTAA